jgi:hypothetical protein
VGGLLAALLLVVSEFTTLFTVSAAVKTIPMRSVNTGSHHSYAMALIGVCGAFLAYGVWRAGSRPALLAVGVLGVIALLIAFLGDLPDAHTSGLVGGGGTTYAIAHSTPSAGMYLETLGALVLLITCVCGFLLLGPPSDR